MGPIQVVVEDGNNLVLEVTPTPDTTVILDRGIAGPPGPAGSGDVDGPASSTDNAVARFDGTTGKLIQNSVVTINDAGALAGVTDLSLSGSITLSGGVANSVPYLNGSKVLTTGSALTFDGTNLGVGTATPAGKLDVAGTLFVSSADGNSGGILSTSGEAGAGNKLIINANRGSGETIFQVSSSEQMRLTSTGLGIGTSSPAYKLDVFGTTPAIRLKANGVGNGVKLEQSSATGDVELNVIDGYPLLFKTSNTERLRLDASGNLGLGVTPSGWAASWKVLEGQGGFVGANSTDGIVVSNNAYSNGTNWIYKNTKAASQYFQLSGAHQWFTAPSGTAGNAISFTQAMTLDANGNLLVGTTGNLNYSARLRVQTQANQYSAEFYGGGSNNTSKVMFANDTGVAGIGSVSSNLVFVAGGDVERARIDASGNLGLGVTPSGWATFKSIDLPAGGYVSSGGDWMEVMMNTYFNGGYKYKVNGYASHYLQQNGAHIWYTAPSGTAGNAISFTQAMTLDASGNLLVGKTGINFGVAGAQFISGAGGSSITSDGIDTLGLNRLSSDGNVIGFYRSSSAVGSISVTTTATAYNTSSDYRLKNTIAPMVNALAKVALLKPCTYKWNADGSDGEGFIAHELAEVVPQCVTGEKDAVDAEGKPQYQGIDTSFLVATLTAALQEQQAIITALTARVGVLESSTLQ